ncbi:MAG: Fibronectin type domain protein [Acidobacteriaceae bacterium]|nr:Fibronectin type domain protein [Acidobacteriaceae bacterium]
MRRYLILVVLFVVTLPVQLSVLGCGSNPNSFCNSFGAGFATRKGTLVSFTLEPQQSGVSLSYGQVGQLTAGAGKDCTGATVSLGTVTYGSSDLNNVDVSPIGQVCAGRWNRLASAGVPAYTTCIPTNQQTVATMTATANGITSSNAVKTYVHPVVTNVTLDTTDSSGAAVTGCLSQFQTAQLNATAFVTNNGVSQLFCAPAGNSAAAPDCRTVLGSVGYAAQNTSSVSGTSSTNTIVSIDTNGVATAKQPGSALITASISGTSSSAGYFYTCPPASISLSANATTNVTVTPNTPQPTTATVIDTKGVTITGVPLTYTSTDQRTIGVSNAGSITSTFPGSSAVYAVCAPGTCNPSPINQIGVNGNGTPIASNTLNVTSPGSSSSLIWMASPRSQYFTAVDLSQNTVGTPIRLPYVPNSMVLDSTGTSLYLGSYRELMIVSAISNTVTKEDTTVPGVVLAVSPTNREVLINDQDRQIFYVYQPATTGTTTTGSNGSAGSTGTPASIVTQYGGVGQHATFSPDGTTLYIVGQNKLYVYSSFTGWSTETLDPSNATASSGVCPANPGTDPNAGGPANVAYNTFCSPDLALAVPQFGAFLSGANTTARGYCPDTRGTLIDNYPSAVPGGAVGYGFASDHLASTTNGQHIVGATANPPQLLDANVVVPTNVPPPTPGAPVSGACPTTTATVNGVTVTKTVPLQITNPNNYPQSLASFAPSLIHQVVTSPNSSLAVVTYEQAAPTPGNALLPIYTIPAPGAAGTLSSVKLTGAQATTPVAAIFSPDYTQIFVSTGGDSNMHIVSTSSLTDTEQFNPNLPDGLGGITPAQFIAVKPRAIP